MCSYKYSVSGCKVISPTVSLIELFDDSRLVLWILFLLDQGKLKIVISPIMY